MNAKVKEKERGIKVTNVRRKAVVNFLRTWRELKGSARQAFSGSSISPEVPSDDQPKLREQMAACLADRGGEVSQRARAVKLGETYLSLNKRGRERFLKMLAEEFDIDREALDEKMHEVEAAETLEDRMIAEAGLYAALVSPRQQILRQFNTLPNGFKFLVDMRADAMASGKKDPYIKGLVQDMKQLLASWFDIGLLDLREITWESPAALLEKLIAYEAVHEIRSWDDLKNRLDSDRRCFAFFHNKMPLEPLIFVEVALVKGLADNVQTLLDEDQPIIDPAEADTAIFYSISNAQKGLAGISFGNFLIKRVVAMLSKELKNIKTYATLSPVPGFRHWLNPILEEGDDSLLKEEEKQVILTFDKGQNAAKALSTVLDMQWQRDEEKAELLKPILMRLCAHYLLNEKRKGRALDPVAHFHLSNGAILERMNWLGDTSKKGMKQSAGIMVNYYYKLSDIDENHEDYVTNGTINASRQVRGLLKK